LHGYALSVQALHGWLAICHWPLSSAHVKVPDFVVVPNFTACSWQDDYPDTWEVEEHVSPDLIQLWERQQGGLDTSSGDGAEGSGGNGAGGGALAATAAANNGVSSAAPAMQLQSSPA
jgi:hypothetical protein